MHASRVFRRKQKRQMTPKQLIKRLKSMQDRIAKDRDKLQDLVSEGEMLIENCDEATDNLERAINALSELV